MNDFKLSDLISVANEKILGYKAFPRFTMLENRAVNINNNTVYTITFTYLNLVFQSIVQVKWVYITNGEELTTLEFMANPQKYQQYLPVFQKMLDTFEFQKK